MLQYQENIKAGYSQIFSDHLENTEMNFRSQTAFYRPKQKVKEKAEVLISPINNY
jgi:hypothetical protein